MDIWTPEKRSEVMSRIKSRGNMSTEIALVQGMRAAGIKGWRTHQPIIADNLKIRPDFVFRPQRVAVFVDGCFWHRCPLHGTVPESNREFWQKKFESNRARDTRNNRVLRGSGWTVVRLWEHSVKKNLESCLRRVKKALV